MRKIRKKRSSVTQVEVICTECCEPYLVHPRRRGRTKFCSFSCAMRAYNRKKAEQRAMRLQSTSPELKVCAQCGEEKPRSEFYAHEKNRDGLRGECKNCCTKKHQIWREENHERKIAMDRAYYEREAERILSEARERYAIDPETILEKNRKWLADNPGKTTEYSRNRRAKHGDKLRAGRREDYRKNKPRYVAHARAREKHIKRATPPWVNLKAIEQFYIEADRVTKLTGIKHHVDHIYPLRGKNFCGLHVSWNLQVIPDVINLRKGNTLPQPVAAVDARCCAWPSPMAMLEAA